MDISRTPPGADDLDAGSGVPDHAGALVSADAIDDGSIPEDTRMSDLDARLPGYIPSDDEQDHYTDVKDNPGYPSTTRPGKMQNRPPDVQGETTKKGKTTKTPSKPTDIDLSILPDNPDNPDNPRLQPLSIRQRRFAAGYADPQSPTYDNITQSYMRAYGQSNPVTAGANGAALVKSRRVQSWIEEILERQDAGIEARVADVVSIAYGKAKPTTIKRTTKDGNGTTTSSVIEERGPSHATRVKAHQLLARIAGDTDQARHANRIAEREYSALLKRNLGKDRPQRNVTRSGKTDSDKPSGQRRGGGD